MWNEQNCVWWKNLLRSFAKENKKKELFIDFHRIGSTDSIRSSVDRKITITKEGPANPGLAAPDLGDNIIAHNNMFVRAQEKSLCCAGMICRFYLWHMANMIIITLTTSRSTQIKYLVCHAEKKPLIFWGAGALTPPLLLMLGGFRDDLLRLAI